MDHPQPHLPALATPGDVITFHSHKGGAGRSTALANIGLLLAGRDHATRPVLMIDWDLDAPGLHQYFQAGDDGPGVLEFFLACREQLRRRRRRPGEDKEGQDGAELARQVLAAVGWERYVVRVDPGRPLYLMRAGRQDSGYAERLAGLDWESLFLSCPALFRCFSELLARHFRHVLVDARSGRGDCAGICTVLLPTRLVLLFEASRQNLDGLQALVLRATTYRRSHEEEQRPLLVYPLPARLDLEDAARRAQCRHGEAGYQPAFERVLGEAYGLTRVSLDSYFDEVQLPQTRALAYGEQLPARDEPLADRLSATRGYESLLLWLEDGHPPWRSRAEMPLLRAVERARSELDDGNARRLLLARELYRLGELHREEGRPLPAMLSFRESVELHAKALGEEHLDTVSAKAQLAGLLLGQGRMDEARLLLRCVVETRARLLGAEHADVLEARAAQARALAGQGHFAAALARQEEVLRVLLRRWGRDHPMTLDGIAARAAMLYQAGELEPARQAQEQVLAARVRLLGAGHAATLEAGEALARTLARMERDDGPLEAGMPPSQGTEPAPRRVSGVQQEPGHYGAGQGAEHAVPPRRAYGAWPYAAQAQPAPREEQAANVFSLWNVRLAPQEPDAAPAPDGERAELP
ncbi:KGGVGR-motif variant AAA ATPase [Pseudoduganella namucuonensis]|uniref:Tetratricopeptide repeat-containing protein n=1 Tax=Pseudoduganella namucuonensis TaxID=1035707 RepID=A0A1I7LBD8_9BURK|nr:tetratricopeptide repeat protein [Pseudoduganella namucuonensis]SFV07010.1 Tetratricopeptide repeat-containing protein [Pseudoduganella namucuonensis]